MDITVAYEPTVAEVEGAIRANSRGARARIIFGVVVLFAGGLFVIVAGTIGDAGGFFAVLGAVFLILGFFFLMIVGSFKTVREREAARLCVPTTATLGGERFSFELPTGPGETRWELTTVVSSAACWTLAVANRVSLVIPKRVLSETEQAEFAGFLAGRDPKLVKTV
jgi:hypothetical protein